MLRGVFVVSSGFWLSLWIYGVPGLISRVFLAFISSCFWIWFYTDLGCGFVVFLILFLLHIFYFVSILVVSSMAMVSWGFWLLFFCGGSDCHFTLLLCICTVDWLSLHVLGLIKHHVWVHHIINYAYAYAHLLNLKSMPSTVIVFMSSMNDGIPSMITMHMQSPLNISFAYSAGARHLHLRHGSLLATPVVACNAYGESKHTNQDSVS